MLHIAASLFFAVAFMGAIAVIVHMLQAYGDRIRDALAYCPDSLDDPAFAPVYHVELRPARVASDFGRASAPTPRPARLSLAA